MFDDVLCASRRGHTAKDTELASELIKAFGFELILQFMPGMPTDTDDTIRKTAEKIISLKPDGVRIYPCTVIKDTDLEDLYNRGEFTPLSVEKAAEICADLIPEFEKNNIKVIRIGLHSSDLVKSQSVVAGPFHPAFGEIVYSKIYLKNAIALLDKNPPKKPVCFEIKKGCISKMTGQKRENIIKLEKKYGQKISIKEVPDLKDFEIRRNDV